MKANRRKWLFRVISHGHAASVFARTRGSAVHQFRRICQPDAARHPWPSPGAVAGVEQLQLVTGEDAWWDDVHIELLNPPAKPAIYVWYTPPPFTPEPKAGKAVQKLAVGLHPATDSPTPRWEWKFHSCGANGGRQPITYNRENGVAA